MLAPCESGSAACYARPLIQRLNPRAPLTAPHASPNLTLQSRSGITPAITRRPEPLKVFDKQRVGGRVHAVVGRGLAVSDISYICCAQRMYPSVRGECRSSNIAR